MNRSTSLRLLVLAAVALTAAAAVAAEPISLDTLLQEMTDRTAVARFPRPAYTCRQASSYDRDATSPDKQETWYANWDRSQFVREEENDGRREFVLMDQSGPGAVVRFWATWHGPRGKPFSNGTLRIYLDENPTPAIEGPIADVIDGGRLCGPPLSQGVSPQTDYKRRGHNLYLPIPYARHCKITYETAAPVDRGARTGEAIYYQINYRTYEEDTAVRSFSMDQLKDLQPRLAAAGRLLLASSLPGGGHLEATTFDGPIAPGKSRSVRLEGPAAIRELTVNLAAENVDRALRCTVLEIEFDSQRTVWCPVGDFFGAGYRLRPYRTWYTRVAPSGSMRCWWAMPFEESCRITLHNLAEEPVRVALGEAKTGRWQWDDRSMHFHAAWRQLADVDTHGKKDMTGHGAFDVNYVTVTGQGVYVGDTLTLHNGAAAWWGEGDEKIYVDGESFPSHFGTGTEDYYGYAWCRPERFEAPFHAQPEGGGNMAGGFSVNSRYRALDAIPFTKSIRFDMELWHWAATTMHYAPATFFYARPGAASNRQPDPAEARRPVWVPPPIGGFVVLKKTGGVVRTQNLTSFGRGIWTADDQLWWTDAKPGDTLDLQLPVKQTGRYEVRVVATKAKDYGIVQFSLDGEKLGEQLDLYNDGVIRTEPIPLGIRELSQGDHVLSVEITGANEKAVKAFMFGLDEVELKPAE